MTGLGGAWATQEDAPSAAVGCIASCGSAAVVAACLPFLALPFTCQSLTARLTNFERGVAGSVAGASSRIIGTGRLLSALLLTILEWLHKHCRAPFTLVDGRADKPIIFDWATWALRNIHSFLSLPEPDLQILSPRVNSSRELALAVPFSTSPYHAIIGTRGTSI
ncbi:hypothetical protein BDP81DRAFT_199374 [Colletotrichum phormii]|uniref:Uncharacterized protein n=1 Tax=Colletotrichum phormii TaxID=359342 RepID=A0AAJ0EGE7_9PEZI|nr:uncharacterized protein BDP81DRAFT_199374 [Colletotrichum phormii]KAK1639247.1 hypothetical protein BDP81DRAFT_199374 [Colletotrichum phormii]